MLNVITMYSFLFFFLLDFKRTVCLNNYALTYVFFSNKYDWKIRKDKEIQNLFIFSKGLGEYEG